MRCVDRGEWGERMIEGMSCTKVLLGGHVVVHHHKPSDDDRGVEEVTGC